MFTENIENYFAHFSPGCFALFCEAYGLGAKLDRAAGMDGGFLWAAVRAVHRGEASCALFSGLTPADFEQDYARKFRRLGESTPGQQPPTLRWIERQHGYNPPSACKPFAFGGTIFDPRKPVTVGMVLADIIAKFDFRHGVSGPLLDPKRDIRAACSALLAEGGYIEGDALRRRGIIPLDRRPLYDLACDKAKEVYTWAVRDIHIAAAALDLDWPGIALDPVAISEWEKTRARISDSGRNLSVFLIHGPKPWTPTACEALGLLRPEE